MRKEGKLDGTFIRLGNSCEHQLAKETDPEIKARLKKAYDHKKSKAAEGIRELPLKDPRAKLVAQAK
eukprot:1684620-Amphidinium_carterae.1